METFNTTSQERFIKLFIMFRNDCRNYEAFNIKFESLFEIDFSNAIQSEQEDLFREIEKNLEYFYSKLHPQAERIRYLNYLKDKISLVNRFNILESIIPKSELNKIDWKQFISGYYNYKDIDRLNINLNDKQIVNTIGLIHQNVRELFDFIDYKLNKEVVPIEITKEEDTSVKMKNSLIDNGILELETVRHLSPRKQEKLIEIIIDPPVEEKRNKVPYRIAMLGYIGFLKKCKNEHPNGRDFGNFLGGIVGENYDDTRKYVNHLYKKHIRYNTYDFFETVKNDYKKIILGR